MSAAAMIGRDEDAKHTGLDESATKITVVVVHNGDVDTDSVGTQINNARAQLSIKYGVQIDWWDADRLVEFALALPADRPAGGLEKQPDPDLLPGAVRPFARLALDSFHLGADGQAFDLAATAKFFECLRSVAGDGNGTISIAAVDQALAASALFLGMIHAQSEVFANSNLLPVIWSAEMAIPVSAHLVLQLGASDRRSARIQTATKALLGIYVRHVTQLILRLEPVAGHRFGLAGATPGERVNYPLRTYDFASMAALAGLAAIDISAKDDEDAALSFLRLSIRGNIEGFSRLVAEDQVVELLIIVRFLLLRSSEGAALHLLKAIARRYLSRATLRAPMPASNSSLQRPLEIGTMVDLVEEVVESAPPRKNRPLHASLALTFALGLLEWRGHSVEPVFSAFKGSVSWQVFNPPSDWEEDWYVSDATSRGCATLMSPETASQLAEQLGASIDPLAADSLAGVGLASMSAFGSKRWRNPLSLEHVVPQQYRPISFSSHTPSKDASEE